MPGRIESERSKLPDIPQRLEHLFIVRIWQEASPARNGPWRGSVEHVPSSQRFYFASLDDLADFIALRVSSNPQEQVSTGKGLAVK